MANANNVRACLVLVLVAVLLAAGSVVDAHVCDATKLAGNVWTSSWWRVPGQHPQAQYAYTFTALNSTHFNVTSTSPAPHGAWWHKGPATGVLDSDFATTGRLSIHFPEGVPHINATIVDQAACAAGRTEIWLDNKSVWCQGRNPGSVQCGTGQHPPEPPPPPGPPSIERVHIVFSTHLDVGYTINANGSCAGAVVNHWFDQLLGAAATAEQFRAKQATWRYQWMIHSWIAAVFRHCATSPINIRGPGYASDLACPSAASLRAFTAAAQAARTDPPPCFLCRPSSGRWCGSSGPPMYCYCCCVGGGAHARVRVRV